MTAVGDRVRLIRCTDDPRLEPGAEGEVRSIDSLGTIHVRWDDGGSLGLVAEAGDRWQVLS